MIQKKGDNFDYRLSTDEGAAVGGSGAGEG